MRRLRIAADVALLIQGLHPTIKRRVRSGIDEILSSPEAGKALRDELAGLRSYRIGRLRLIYRIASRGIIQIVALGPRAVIYQETLRLLKRERGD